MVYLPQEAFLVSISVAARRIVITILQQQDEISKLGQEQDLTRELLDEQIRVLRATARLNYLNDVIARQRKVLEDNPDNGSHSSGLWYQNAKHRFENSIEERETLVRGLEN